MSKNETVIILLYLICSDRLRSWRLVGVVRVRRLLRRRDLVAQPRGHSARVERRHPVPDARGEEDVHGNKMQQEEIGQSIRFERYER